MSICFVLRKGTKSGKREQKRNEQKTQTRKKNCLFHLNYELSDKSPSKKKKNDKNCCQCGVLNEVKSISKTHLLHSYPGVIKMIKVNVIG